jgi:hypothetical protein
MEHKQASLEELGALADPPLTKDAVAGRIRRLLAMADKRAQDLGIPGTESSSPRRWPTTSRAGGGPFRDHSSRIPDPPSAVPAMPIAAAAG